MEPGPSRFMCEEQTFVKGREVSVFLQKEDTFNDSLRNCAILLFCYCDVRL